MSLKLITAPAIEPITRQEAKLHCRIIADVADVSPHPEDTLVDGLIAAARQEAEHLTGRALITQTWELALDQFDDSIKLPKPPLASVASVKYLDSAGILQTLPNTGYLLDDHSEPARLLPAYGTSWPATRIQPNAVLIRYDAGYGLAANVPQAIKQWMLLQIGAMFENRESTVQGNVTSLQFADGLLDPFRIWSV